MAVNRAKIPLAVSIWKTNLYILNESKKAAMRKKTLFFICIIRMNKTKEIIYGTRTNKIK
jgi:hypothetical protein